MIFFRSLLLFWQTLGKVQIGFYLAIYWLLELTLLSLSPFLPKVVEFHFFISTTFGEMVKVVESRHRLNGKS